MPLYEYYCEGCDAVFEALARSARRAAEPAACPACDEDAKRVVSRDFQAFVFREGSPRRIPDRGTYWHLEQEVSAPIAGTALPGEHPELTYRKSGPAAIPSAEEREQFEFQMEQKLERIAEDVASDGGATTVNLYEEHREREFLGRVDQTAARARRARRRAPNRETTPRTRGALRPSEPARSADAP